MSIEVTKDNLAAVTANKLTVIDFWAPWCGPCKIMAPVIEELAQEFSGQIEFGKFNVENDATTPLDYKVMGIPSLVIFKNGQAVEKITGVYPKEKLVQYLNTKLAEVNETA